MSTSYLCFESSSSRSGSSKKNKVIKLVDITDIQKVTRKKKKKNQFVICIFNKLTSACLSPSCSTKFCPSYQEVGWASLSPRRPRRRYHIEIYSASSFNTHLSLTCRQTTICTHTHTPAGSWEFVRGSWGNPHVDTGPESHPQSCEAAAPAVAWLCVWTALLISTSDFGFDCVFWQKRHFNETFIYLLEWAEELTGFSRFTPTVAQEFYLIRY